MNKQSTSLFPLARKKANLKLGIVFVFLFSFLFIPKFAYAGFLDGLTCINDGSCGFSDIEQGFIALTKWLIGGIGALALLYFVWGGIQWLTSYGNQQKIQKGREIMLQTVIALVIAFMSYILVEFFVNDILKVKQEVQVNTNTRYEEINIAPSTMHCCFNVNANPQCQQQLSSCGEGFNDLGTENCLNYDECVPALPE